jgi:8-oxo-dGTP pyrophosphatase MutT (NUDIX family)
MHRNQILNLLKSYQPTAIDEIAYKKQIIEFIEQNEDCFERTHPKGHLTASAWLLNNNKSKVLLTHHAKLGTWVQLGGHCDGDSNVLAVAIKEAQEESGIDEIVPLSNEIFDIDVHLVPANAKDAAHHHYDIRFLLQVLGNETFKVSEESKDLMWVDKELVKLPTNERSITRMFEKWVG